MMARDKRSMNILYRKISKSMLNNVTVFDIGLHIDRPFTERLASDAQNGERRHSVVADVK